MVLREIISLCLPCLGRKRSGGGGRWELNENIAPFRAAVSSTGRWQVYDATPPRRKGNAKNNLEVYVIGELTDSPRGVERRSTRMKGSCRKRQVAATKDAAIQTETVGDLNSLELSGSVPRQDLRKRSGGNSSKDFCRCFGKVHSYVGKEHRPGSDKSHLRQKRDSRCVNEEKSGNSIFCCYNYENSRRPCASSSDNDTVQNSCNICHVRNTVSNCCEIRASWYWELERVYSSNECDLTGRTSNARSSCCSCYSGRCESRRRSEFSAYSSEENHCCCCDGNCNDRFDRTISNSGGGYSSANSRYYSSQCIKCCYLSSGISGCSSWSSRSCDSSECWNSGSSVGSKSSGSDTSTSRRFSFW